MALVHSFATEIEYYVWINVAPKHGLDTHSLKIVGTDNPQNADLGVGPLSV